MKTTHLLEALLTFSYDIQLRVGLLLETHTKVTCSQLWQLYTCTFCIQEAEVEDCCKFRVCLDYVMSSQKLEIKSEILAKPKAGQWAKVLAPKPDNLGLNLGLTSWKYRTDSVSCPSHECTHTHTHTTNTSK